MTVEYLPIWKQGATVAERLEELAMVARKHPERFGRLVVVYEEALPDNHTILRNITAGCTTNESLGILTIAINDIIEENRAHREDDN